MGDPHDTSLYVGDRKFPSTQWSQFLSTICGPPELTRTKLESLAQGYWKPVYAFIRTR